MSEHTVFARFDDAVPLYKLLGYLSEVQCNIPLTFDSSGFTIHQCNGFSIGGVLKSKKKLHNVPIINVATIHADELSEYYYDEETLGESHTIVVDGALLVRSMPNIKAKSKLDLYLDTHGDLCYVINGGGVGTITPLIGTEHEAPAPCEFPLPSCRPTVEAFNEFADATRNASKGIPVDVEVYTEGISFAVKAYGQTNGRKTTFGHCEGDVVQSYAISSDFFTCIHNKINKISAPTAVIKLSSANKTLRLEARIGSGAYGDLAIYVTGEAPE